MKNVPEKTGNLPNFSGFAKGGGYPQFGKRPNYFRFFLVKASLKPNVVVQDFPEIEIAVAPFACNVCGKSFNMRSKVERHLSLSQMRGALQEHFKQSFEEKKCQLCCNKKGRVDSRACYTILEDNMR